MELEMFLEKGGKEDLLEMVKDIADLVNIQYVRQKEALGLGHAIYSASRSIGNEPFAVLLGDDIIDSERPCLEQMIEYYNEYGGNLIGVQQVSLEDASKYGIITGNALAPRLFKAENLVEKPAAHEISGPPLAIMGRYILNPEIFDILAEQTPGRGGEIQLTDAIQTLSRTQPIYAYAFEGKRYDVGDKLGFVRATIEYALRHDEIGDALMEYLSNLVHLYEQKGGDLNLSSYPHEKYRYFLSNLSEEKSKKIQ
jgi:UTP--glucose-1-phosphate uridylyltransferase